MKEQAKELSERVGQVVSTFMLIQESLRKNGIEKTLEDINGICELYLPIKQAILMEEDADLLKEYNAMIGTIKGFRKLIIF